MYNKDDFFDKIDKFQVSNKDFATMINVSQGNLSDWKNGRSKPNVDAIVKIADTFNVTTDYLLGRDETKKEPTVIANDALNPEIHKIIKKLTTSNIPDEVISFINTALDKYTK